jgi:hypothetical protein
LRNSTAEIHSRVFVSATSPSKIQFDDREYASRDEMPPNIREAYDRAVHETPALHSGARLAAKLKAKIIVNDTEFSHAGEMSVDDRHLYHEALEAVFPPSIAVATSEPRKIRHNKVLLIVVAITRRCLSLAAQLLRLKR